MNATSLSASSSLKPTFWQFDDYMYQTHQEAETLLAQPGGREKIAALAKRFFIDLLEHLEEFNGADPALNRLVDRLDPYKPKEVTIEPLLKKIIRDLRRQNERLAMECQKKVVAFSTSLAAFPMPLVDTTVACAEQTSCYLRGEKVSFSLAEIFEACSLLVSQNMKDRAKLLFYSQGIKHFVADPKRFSREIVSYGQNSQGILEASTILVNTNNLRKLLQDLVMEWEYMYITRKIPPELFVWLQEGGPGVKELFEGYAKLRVIGAVEEAFESFKKAANLGHSQGFVEMAQLKLLDDPIAAWDYLNKGVDLGNTKALVVLGRIYRYGTTRILQDKNKAFQYFKKAADCGDAEALSRLSYCYEMGCGVEKNQVTAFEYDMKAKNLMSPEGAIGVARRLIKGEGTPKDLKEAKVILEDLLDRGDEGARFLYDEHFSKPNPT